MTCEPECTCSDDVIRRYNDAVARIRSEVSIRARMCRTIAARARRFNLDVTPERVDRHYDWFIRWYHGGIATGYLIKRTGIKRIVSTRK